MEFSQVVLDERALAQINAQAKKTLSADEVYAFCVKLCDNQVDRDFERFPLASLREIASLMVGKPGVFDHEWSAKEQCARIYRTEVVQEAQPSIGEGYAYVKAWAYILRTEKHAALIAEIEGGIKKEVSISCAVGRKLCSVCGSAVGTCRHAAGKTYEDELCYSDLLGITDAYEWSFVAVPAQPRAGVLKAKKQEGNAMDLQEMVQKEPALRAQLEALESEAALGRKYLQQLRQEVARLGALALPQLGMKEMTRVAQRMDEEALLEMKTAYEAQLSWLEGKPQLPSYQEQGHSSRDDAAYLI